MFNVYKNQPSRQTGSRNLMGPKTLPTIWGSYMKLVTKYQISAINSCWEKCDEKCAYNGRNLIFGHKLHIGMPYCGKPFWTHQIPTSCLPTVDFYTHWTYMFIFCRIFLSNCSRYGVSIWRLWPNIRFLPSIVAEKNATKNILGWMEGRTEVKQHTPTPAFFSATVDGRNLIFRHNLHIGMQYCGKCFWTHQIPTSCLLT
jgi:hypothetical protein